MNERNNERKNEEQVLGKGQRVLARIEDIGAQGQGIGRIEGLVVFVPGAFPGDEVRVRITDVRKNYATAAGIDCISFDCAYGGSVSARSCLRRMCIPGVALRRAAYAQRGNGARGAAPHRGYRGSSRAADPRHGASV